MNGCRRTLACCFLLVLAGCSGFAGERATDRGTLGNASVAETTTDAEPSTVAEPTVDGHRNASDLSVNATRVVDRTERLLGVDFRTPSVVVSNDSTVPRLAYASKGAFASALGVRNSTETISQGAGTVVPDAETIGILLTNRSTPADVRTALVHGYVQATNLQRPSYEPVFRSLRPGNEGKRAAGAIRAGSATFVAQAYAERYGDAVAERDTVCEVYDDGSGATRMRSGWYCVGARYVDDRIDDPANLDAVYRNPPNTTEQVRHGYLPTEEPPVALDVTAARNDDWQPVDRERHGELWTYALLSTFLSDARADTAATGWGNDERVTYREFERDGYAWVSRWDSAQDADEFTEAMRAHVANASAGNATNASFAVERVDSTTVVVLVGDDEFVDGTTVTTANDTAVVVRPPNATATDRTRSGTGTLPRTPGPFRSLLREPEPGTLLS